MELESGRLEVERTFLGRIERQFDLMRNRGRDRCGRVCNPRDNRPVVMPANDPLDLGMTGNYGREFRVIA
jgi:hypothetical protein